jgi:hypothetical protein
MEHLWKELHLLNDTESRRQLHRDEEHLHQRRYPEHQLDELVEQQSQDELLPDGCLTLVVAHLDV